MDSSRWSGRGTGPSHLKTWAFRGSMPCVPQSSAMYVCQKRKSLFVLIHENRKLCIITPIMRAVKCIKYLRQFSFHWACVISTILLHVLNLQIRTCQSLVLLEWILLIGGFTSALLTIALSLYRFWFSKPGEADYVFAILLVFHSGKLRTRGMEVQLPLSSPINSFCLSWW